MCGRELLVASLVMDWVWGWWKGKSRVYVTLSWHCSPLLLTTAWLSSGKCHFPTLYPCGLRRAPCDQGCANQFLTPYSFRDWQVTQSEPILHLLGKKASNICQWPWTWQGRCYSCFTQVEPENNAKRRQMRETERNKILLLLFGSWIRPCLKPLYP